MTNSKEYQDQIALQFRLKRIERMPTPALEAASAVAIAEAFRKLIETSYFYQKIAVDLTGVPGAIEELANLLLKQQIASEQGMSVASNERRQKELAQQLSWQMPSFLEEPSFRPWQIHTRHMGDTPEDVEMHKSLTARTDSGNKELSKRAIPFLLNSVDLLCPTPGCRMRPFEPLNFSAYESVGSVYPRVAPVKKELEQVFTPAFRCGKCRETVFTVLVHRVGLRLHLCGFAPRRGLPATVELPEPLPQILRDAEQAAAEDDLFGAFYHLRTLVEHYLKTRLAIPLETQKRGDDLVAEYNASLAPEISSLLPSLSTPYSDLSRWMHSRTGEQSDYEKTRADVCKHITKLIAIES